MNLKELAMFSLGVEQYKKLEAEIIAAYIEQQAKEVPVLPEPDVYEYDIETAMNVLKAHSQEQLQAYGLQCAAHARDVALSEAKQVMEKQHTWITNVAAAQLIEALKKAGK